MYTDGKIYMGLADGERVNMYLNMANRHGLIAGASGTGKTITMKAMAESFSDAGVPVFLCDVKGDVSGLAEPGAQSDGMEKRIDKFGIRQEFSYKAYPVCFWDIYQEGGHPVRATISDMGPEILSRILGLTPAQEGVLNIIFKIADDRGLLLIDLKDLRTTINYVAEHKDEYTLSYGNMSTQSLGGIVRALLPLETQGGDLFFGEPDLDIFDWMRTDVYGKGMVNILNCVKLVQNPTLYASFMLWMMAELFEKTEFKNAALPVYVNYNAQPLTDGAEIADMLSGTMHKGVTVIPGEGWYTKKASHILMVITRKRDLKTVLAAVKAYDPSAFLSVSSVMGVYGRGFDVIRGANKKPESV